MKRLESIQIMRGIAATMVMIHHFTYANPGFAASFPAFTALFQNFSLGVWMFFVISGFVIPYAMYSIDYRISTDAWPFFLRRLVRLEPTYIVSVLVAFALTFAAARTLWRSAGAFAARFFAAISLSQPVVPHSVAHRSGVDACDRISVLFVHAARGPTAVVAIAADHDRVFRGGTCDVAPRHRRARPVSLFALLCDRVRRFPVPCQTHRIFAVAGALPRVFDLYLI
jgi:Acyltransferase family